MKNDEFKEASERFFLLSKITSFLQATENVMEDNLKINETKSGFFQSISNYFSKLSLDVVNGIKKSFINHGENGFFTALGKNIKNYFPDNKLAVLPLIGLCLLSNSFVLFNAGFAAFLVSTLVSFASFIAVDFILTTLVTSIIAKVDYDKFLDEYKKNQHNDNKLITGICYLDQGIKVANKVYNNYDKNSSLNLRKSIDTRKVTDGYWLNTYRSWAKKHEPSIRNK